MDPFENIAITQSLRPIFNDVKVSQYDLQRVIETTSWAPSPFNSQPWEFVIIQDDEHIREIAKLVAPAVDCSQMDLTQEQVGKYLAKQSNLMFYLHDTSRQDPGENAYKLGLISMGTAFANLSITASAAGIGLQPVYFDKRQELVATIKKHLKIPDDLEICCLFAMGYLKDKKELVREKPKPVDIHENFYGKQRHIETLPPNDVEYNPFFLVKKRKSYRKLFLDQKLTVQDENYLIKAARDAFNFNEKRTWELVLIKDRRLIEDFAQLITKIAYKIHLDEGYSQRMQAWMRYTHEEKTRKADGVLLTVWGKVLGFLLKKATIIMETSFIMRPCRLLFVKFISREFFGDLLRNSPLLLVITHNKKHQEQAKTPFFLNLMSIGIVTQNLLLAATSRKLGVQFLSILLDTGEGRQEVRKLLNLPQEVEVVDMVRVGYIDPGASAKVLSVSSGVRRPVENIVHMEFF